ncbi:hypothetical protein ACEPAF_792 [Sanghuangporus sanghuang]
MSYALWELLNIRITPNGCVSDFLSFGPRVVHMNTCNLVFYDSLALVVPIKETSIPATPIAGKPDFVSMRRIFSYSLTSLLSLLVRSTSADSPQVIDLGYASYQGILNSTTNITSFLGLRYAHPPTGNLRFQAPQDPLIVSGVQSATKLGRVCPQGAQGLAASSPLSRRATNDEIEDCLFANVYVPGPVIPSARLPVIIFIHGGGYVSGSITVTDGGDLIRAGDGGVVVVEIAYRLGVFGFLSSKEVKNHGVLNAGLLDQEFALKWVQKHISSFGGDPARVTIWGESAGAGSVLQHMIAHGGNTEPPLFHAAMTSSMFLPSQYYYDDAVPEQLYSQVIEKAGCSNASDTFSCLVGTDAAVLEAANLAICQSSFFGTFAFVPVVDGEFIVDRPTEIISRGRFNGDLLLSVTNSFEGRIFVNSNFTANMTLEEYVGQLFPAFGEEHIRATVERYSGVEGLDNLFNQSIAIMGESIFICPTYTLLTGFHGPSFKGLFAVPPANHGSNIGYYFPSNRPPPVQNIQLIASFAGSFLGVVKSRNPNVNPLDEVITPYWPQFNAENEMLFNSTTTGQAIVQALKTDKALLKRCEFWRRVSKYTSQ